MYTSFQIKNFRCFDNLKIDKLARVNLISGKNNVGKTALLEALYIHLGSYNVELTVRINAFRGIEGFKLEFTSISQTIWDTLFKSFDTSKEITLTGQDNRLGRETIRLEILRNQRELAEITRTYQQSENGGDKTTLSGASSQIMRLTYEDKSKTPKKYHMLVDSQGHITTRSIPPPTRPGYYFPSRFRFPLAEDAERYGNLVRLKQENVVLKILQLVEPKLQSLIVIPSGGVSAIHGDIGLNQLVQLQLMGDGINRLASIIIALGNTKKGVALIDEVDNGLHYSVLKDVWKGIAEAARLFDVQVFATTHSLECIRAAHEAFSESEEYDFRYHRLDRNENTGSISVETYDQSLMDAVVKADFEVRG